jgi:hypothetical protein
VAAGDTEGITNIDLVRIREKLGARAKRDQVASHGFEDTETAAIADLWALASDHAQDVVDEYPALASMLGLRQPGGRPRGRGVRVMARRKRHSETAVPTTQEPDWDARLEEALREAEAFDLDAYREQLRRVYSVEKLFLTGGPNEIARVGAILQGRTTYDRQAPLAPGSDVTRNESVNVLEEERELRRQAARDRIAKQKAQHERDQAMREHRRRELERAAEESVGPVRWERMDEDERAEVRARVKQQRAANMVRGALSMGAGMFGENPNREPAWGTDPQGRLVTVGEGEVNDG